MAGEIAAVLVNPAIGKDAIPSSSRRDSDRDSSDESRCHQASKWFQEDNGIDAIPEEAYEFSERFVARGRENFVEVRMMLQHRRCLLTGKKENSSVGETTTKSCGNRQAQDFISYSIWTSKENFHRLANSQPRKFVAPFGQHGFYSHGVCLLVAVTSRREAGPHKGNAPALFQTEK
jgi:hypothetical protein